MLFFVKRHDFFMLFVQLQTVSNLLMQVLTFLLYPYIYYLIYNQPIYKEKPR